MASISSILEVISLTLSNGINLVSISKSSPIFIKVSSIGRFFVNAFSTTIPTLVGLVSCLNIFRSSVYDWDVVIEV